MPAPAAVAPPAVAAPAPTPAAVAPPTPAAVAPPAAANIGIGILFYLLEWSNFIVYHISFIVFIPVDDNFFAAIIF